MCMWVLCMCVQERGRGGGGEREGCLCVYVHVCLFCASFVLFFSSFCCTDQMVLLLITDVGAGLANQLGRGCG